MGALVLVIVFGAGIVVGFRLGRKKTQSYNVDQIFFRR